MLIILRYRRLKAALLFFLLALYSIYWYLHEGQWVIPVSSFMTKGKMVCLDPGHGGRDPGAVFGSINEKNLNLDIAKRVAVLLKKEGVRVFLTRTKDSNLAHKSFEGSMQRAELRERLLLAKKRKSDIFVSIHCNSEEKAAHFGPQTFYQENSQESILLASIIQRELIKVLSTHRQAIPGRYYLMENSSIPTVIVEIGYLSHPKDRSLLAESNFRQSVAKAITKGILVFLKN